MFSTLRSSVTRQCRAVLNLCGDAMKSGFHTSEVLDHRYRKNPTHKWMIKPFAKATLPNMVGRGMRLAEPQKAYTIHPLKVVKTGGRGVDGRLELLRTGGGKKVEFRMVDFVRIRQEEPSPRTEIVRKIFEDQTRSAYLALVVSGEVKRYIIATSTIKEGDIINNYNVIPVIPVKPREGDAHPLGALPLGTQVCCIERKPGGGAKVANAAGSTATLVRRIGEVCTVRMPSKREMQVSSKCIAVVGRVSNVDQCKKKLGKAGAKRWLGYRPASGWWKRKTGICGRTIKKTPAPIVYAPRPQKLLATGSLLPKAKHNPFAAKTYKSFTISLRQIQRNSPL